MDLRANPHVLDNFSCFEHLSLEQKDVLLRNSKAHKLGKNKLVFAQGEMCQRLYFLTKGSVKIYTVETDTHKEHISSIEHRDNIFGECCLFDSPVKAFNAVTIDEENFIFSVDIDVFRSLMQQNFNFNLAVFKMIGEKYQRSQERLEDFATKDARARILEFLKGNAEEVGKKIGFETLVKHGLSQQDIATYTGTSRQTVTTVLNDLKKSNQIYLRRKSILIRDLASLN